MQDQPSPIPTEEEDRIDLAILTLMLEPQSRNPWSVEEITREIDDQSLAVDALDRLVGAGLLHRCGPFAFPTRAALRAGALLG